MMEYAVIANSYRDQGDYQESIRYCLAYLNLTKASDNLPERIIYNAAIASIYLKKKQLDSALYFLHLSLSYPPSPIGDGWVYTVAGEAYAALKLYDTASMFYHKSILLLREAGNLKDLAGAFTDLAKLFNTAGSRDSAILYAHGALDISRRKKFPKEILEASLLMAELYERSNADSALYYYKQARIAGDTLYDQEKQRQITSYKFNEQLHQQELQQQLARANIVYRNRLNNYFLLSGLVILIIVAGGLWRRNVFRHRSYLLLKKQKQETDIQKGMVEKTLDELKATQSQLIQSEKMASLGELTAGIAHEIQNPLNFMNNFSEVNKELIEEMKQELIEGNVPAATAIANNIQQNEDKINHHGKRADAIVKGMLQHSQTSAGKKEPTDINALADEYLRLAYHGYRAKEKFFNVMMKTNYDESIGKINIIPQDMGRVLLNLYNNAFYAVSDKKKQLPEGYEPAVSVNTKKINGKIEIRIMDNGNGIPQKVVDKIFQPFFTTKPTGQGTGLGLSMSYDIIKAHRGDIKVETKEGKFAEFIVQIPAV
jgi:two-component system, NtrC family, sensor kinase